MVSIVGRGWREVVDGFMLESFEGGLIELFASESRVQKSWLHES